MMSCENANSEDQGPNGKQQSRAREHRGGPRISRQRRKKANGDDPDDVSPGERARAGNGHAGEQTSEEPRRDGTGHSSVGLTPSYLIKPEKLTFLWEPYIPRGVLSILEGDPDLMKSFMALAIAADLSRGRALPGQQPQAPQHSFIFTAEDSAAVTVIPRLMALDADLTKIDVSEKAFALNPDALHRLEADIVKCNAAFVVFDGFMTYVASAMDTYKAPEVGKFMYELFDIAKRTNAAIMLLRHLKKGGDANPKYRGLGSIAFFGSIRAGLQVESEAGDGNPPGIAEHHKHNYSGKAPSLRYGWVDGRFKWLGFVSGERQVCRTRRPGPAPVQTDNAKAFLLHVLKDRPELPFVVRRMAKDEGISDWALEQAKRGLGLVQVIAKDGRMHWALPAQTTTTTTPPCS